MHLQHIANSNVCCCFLLSIISQATHELLWLLCYACMRMTESDVLYFIFLYFFLSIFCITYIRYHCFKLLLLGRLMFCHRQFSFFFFCHCSSWEFIVLTVAPQGYNTIHISSYSAIISNNHTYHIIYKKKIHKSQAHAFTYFSIQKNRTNFFNREIYSFFCCSMPKTILFDEDQKKKYCVWEKSNLNPSILVVFFLIRT